MKKISVIIPCYNEEKVLPAYFEAVDKIIPTLENYVLDFFLVNDGSSDDTLNVMKEISRKRKDVFIVNLSRNFGQNPAFAAGLKSCDGDYAIMMDSDLQDPVELICEISKKFDEGYEVVNPHRVNRMKDSAFKRTSAGLFYMIINALEGKKVIPENVNCFRGISRRVIDEINSLSEKDRYILSEVPLVGFKTCYIDFARNERSAGASKYNLNKMVRYAFDNMSTATSSPLYWPMKCGLFASIILFVLMILFLVLMLVNQNIAIFSTLFIAFVIFFSASVLLCFIGILGIYLHNVLINTRNRPTYVIDEVIAPLGEED